MHPALPDNVSLLVRGVGEEVMPHFVDVVFVALALPLDVVWIVITLKLKSIVRASLVLTVRRVVPNIFEFNSPVVSIFKFSFLVQLRFEVYELTTSTYRSRNQPPD